MASNMASDRDDLAEAETTNNAPAEIDTEALHMRQSQQKSLPESEYQTSIQTLPRSRLDLATIFNNPIILSSFIKNFHRKDYGMLAKLAAATPGVTPWPQWDPMTQPWPWGTLPFSIRDLSVQCQNESRASTRYLTTKFSHSEYTECEWKYRHRDLFLGGCHRSEKNQGVRPRSGPNPNKEMEKKPLEFLECAGYRLKFQDCGVFDVANLERMTRFEARVPKQDQPRTVDIRRKGLPHSSGVMICSDCAYRNHVDKGLCLWGHHRMTPLCRDCSTEPSETDYDLSIGPGQSSLYSNITKFSESAGTHRECNCHERLSPANGFYFCTECQVKFCRMLTGHTVLVRRRLYARTGVNNYINLYENHKNPTAPRNYCPCGKTWDELVHSWNEFSVAERDKKMYRLCLMCLGHVPRSKFNTARPSTCL